MKKFLFSRSHKRHYTSAVVRMGKNNLGFSIVELVIVIAIMAILVAVAIPVLTVFIKKTEKANDKEVIADILYAIELANEADAFAEYKQTALGDIEYPIAFIVIGERETQVVTSSTSIQYDDTPCDFQFKTISTFVKTGEWSEPCPNISSGSYTVKGDIYDVQSVQYEYCATHTPKNAFAETTETQQKPRDYKHVGTKKQVYGDYYYCKGCGKEAIEFVTIPIGSTIIPNEEIVCKRSSVNTNICSAAYQNSYGTIDKNTIGTTHTNTEHAVYQALFNVFGPSFTTDLTLTHKEWMSDGNLNYSTFYSSADDMFNTIESLCDIISPISSVSFIKNAASALGVNIKGTYDSSSEVLDSVAATIIDKHPNYASWEAAWIDAKDGNTAYAFGFSGSDGMENYAACRKGYNAAFASYLEACDKPEYANVVMNYNSMSLDIVNYNLQMPATITMQSFYTGSEKDFNSETMNTYLYQQLGNDAKKLAEVKEYYEQYLVSDAYLANAKAFYDTMQTVTETGGVAESSGDYFEYYNGYINEIGSMYDTVAEASKNGNLVIIVSLKDGKAVCTLSNSEADPRNE